MVVAAAEGGLSDAERAATPWALERLEANLTRGAADQC
ncbi:hypothetical protein SCATT_p10590 (plasmid) [Streptantibioticus cattleyicolor NRRL 8057 = DSM 46488]|uniref:Uncharacterized protein n=1 Tax=Streptantibioticus cattleyicolor (strain ATCC 35852 / DSM 46488 / JCM 4925 / NBRC 14057 / NRRL 8057) TaxID=1003195 RepID=F8JMC0_STREN|nr:hypothetical protein SCATT_p10590 [Streptantibioticus cattleyicolor NRRL 8057 = DSM 46488]CCB71705.1 protein of unknown function [Streptantibioticus cattleyicolor NRRL 8057 = DSM 46488]